MPFGLSNAPTIFMDLINFDFCKYLKKFVIVFINDILIYSSNPEEREENLRLILHTLKEHQLYVKLSKFKFWLSKAHFLGHVMSTEGITMALD